MGSFKLGFTITENIEHTRLSSGCCTSTKMGIVVNAYIKEPNNNAYTSFKTKTKTTLGSFPSESSRLHLQFYWVYDLDLSLNCQSL